MEGTIVDSQRETIAEKIEKIFSPRDLLSPVCPVRDILDKVGDKWSVLSILYLGWHGKMRFNALRHQIDGLSQRMLTVTLRSLEHDGYVTRTVYPEVPPRVEYELTPLGLSLLEQVLGLAQWAQTHRDDIVASRNARERSDPFT
ncbi:MAG: helix-turn-helix transcriptional regulator [Ferruginibacter sp.]|nr:helix-turn-helix transcriptional regulator [Cytophagales bacterium]